MNVIKKKLTKWFGWHFHEWVKYNEVFHSSFEGEPTTSEYDKYRYCPVCKSVQEYHYDSGGGSWSYLSDQCTKIWRKHRGL